MVAFKQDINKFAAFVLMRKLSTLKVGSSECESFLVGLLGTVIEIPTMTVERLTRLFGIHPATVWPAYAQQGVDALLAQFNSLSDFEKFASAEFLVSPQSTDYLTPLMGGIQMTLDTLDTDVGISLAVETSAAIKLSILASVIQNSIKVATDTTNELPMEERHKFFIRLIQRRLVELLNA